MKKDGSSERFFVFFPTSEDVDDYVDEEDTDALEKMYSHHLILCLNIHKERLSNKM